MNVVRRSAFSLLVVTLALSAISSCVTMPRVNAATCIGTDANDTLYCSTGNDTVDGKGGDDELHGLAGNDSMFGRLGEDQIYGEGGADTIEGGDSTCCLEFLLGNAGNDILTDTATGGDYEDACGGNGDDWINVQDGDNKDLAIGGADSDTANLDSGDYWNAGDLLCPP